MNMNGNQDWNPVVIRKRAPSGADLKDEAAVNAARRAGAAVDTVKKYNAGSNKAGASTTTGMSAAKLDNETEDFHRASPAPSFFGGVAGWGLWGADAGKGSAGYGVGEVWGEAACGSWSEQRAWL